MSTYQIKRLEAAMVDGRTHNHFFRQAQLERLCKCILAKETLLRDAMISDSEYTPHEAIAVLHASLQAVKQCYASLQPKQALEDEYRVARGVDAIDNEVPVGMVYIEADTHTLLYSICSPLCAAIAAGSCVVLLLENNLLKLPALIRQILTDALDADIFAVATSPLNSSIHKERTISVRQTVNAACPSSHELVSPANTSVVAVVDRSADIKAAASEIIQARSSFCGRSPYAPRVVFVDEFFLQEFVDAMNPRHYEDGRVNVLDKSQSLKLDFHARTGTTLSVADVDLRQIIQTKASTAVTHILPIRSLDHAIDLLSETQTTSYMAAYHFCNLRTAKYLSQFVSAEVTFVNQIPPMLLIGPAAPTGHKFELEHRYSASLFSCQRPAFVRPSPSCRKLTTALRSSDDDSAQKLLREAIEPLKVMKRSDGGGVGFFEQGFLLNFSFIFVGALGLTIAGAWYQWNQRRSR